MAVSRRRLVDDRLGEVASGDHRVCGCGRAMLAMGEGHGEVAVGNAGARLGRETNGDGRVQTWCGVWHGP